MTDALYYDRDWLFVWKCMKAYLGNWRWVLWVLLAGTLICFAQAICSRKSNQGVYASGGMLLLTVTLLNPWLVLKVLDRLVEPAAYYRFFWALPMTVIGAYFLTRLVVKAPGKFGKFAALCVIALLLFLGRDKSHVLTVNLHIPENIYKVPDGLIYACDIIHEDYQDDTGRRPRAVFSDRYELFCRQYDASIRLTIDRDLRLAYNGSQTVGTVSQSKANKRRIQILDAINSQNDITIKQFRRAMTRTRTDYIIIPDYFTSHEFLLEAGCEKLGEGEGVVVYRFDWQSS
ncbi:MAG: hypothetical protein IJI24_09440 [Lachnospiraceae bacterium]|nr:hypothetical protein [Lachnospiraceae bacterium]